MTQAASGEKAMKPCDVLARTKETSLRFSAAVYEAKVPGFARAWRPVERFAAGRRICAAGLAVDFSTRNRSEL